MIVEDLFNQVLLEPAERGADTLYVISGYASPSLALKHLQCTSHRGVHVHIIYGMSCDGIGRKTHEAFKSCTTDFSKRFSCSYMLPQRSVHIKSYAWFKKDRPVCAFTGSPNYTIQGFMSNLEAVAEDNPEDIVKVFKQLSMNSVNCIDPAVEQSIQFIDELRYQRHRAMVEEHRASGDDQATATSAYDDFSHPSVSISLLDRYGKLPAISGLNWGQRDGREPNQAYIRVPKEVYSIDFFPRQTERFILLTDDGNSFHCTTAQNSPMPGRGKAVQTWEDNSILGRYFRKRLGLKPGSLITEQHLFQYGRTDITFYRIEDYVYYMDFSGKHS